MRKRADGRRWKDQLRHKLPESAGAVLCECVDLKRLHLQLLSIYPGVRSLGHAVVKPGITTVMVFALDC